MSGVLKRIAQLALAFCALLPLIAAAHGNHHPSRKADASFVRAIAVAASHCPTDGGGPCGCHNLSCTRLCEPDTIDVGPAACAFQHSSVPALLLLDAALAPRSAPLPTFPPRAPPVSS